MQDSSETAATAKSSSNTNGLLVLSYGTLIGIWTVSQFIFIPYQLHLMVMVASILYVACHWSLTLCEEVSDDDNDKNKDGGDNNEVKSKNKRINIGETLSKEDAMSFPIIGSLSLFSMYLAFKFLDRALVNLLIGCYFCILGTLSMTASASPFLSSLLSLFVPSSISDKTYTIKKSINHSLPTFLLGESPLEFMIEFNLVDIVSFIPSAITTYFYFQDKYWALNNVLGISFCLQGIQRFSLGTYKIGAILLTGLFFYDIFWVFGTEVMVTVAKNLDGPIKILFPRDSLIKNTDTGKLDLSLLGLGDIVIPGFFLALLLRFDAINANIPRTNFVNVHHPFPKPYFHSCLIAYLFGLGLTLFIMVKFNSAQPALLYLVPACLGSSMITALVRNEIKELFEYSEEQEEDEEEQEKENILSKEEQEKVKKDS